MSWARDTLLCPGPTRESPQPLISTHPPAECQYGEQAGPVGPHGANACACRACGSGARMEAALGQQEEAW